MKIPQNHNALVRQYAYRYAESGYHVIPIPVESKAPKMPNWQNIATIDKGQIDRWWADDEQPMNIGIVTGSKSGITVIDIDCGPGKDGAATWAELVREKGEPATKTVLTGGGGMHLYFRYNSALKTAGNVLGKHVDCRNDAGQVIAPPSIHASGNRYEWAADTDWTQPVADLPEHLTHKPGETRGRKRKDDYINKSHSIEEVEEMLRLIPADDRDLWRAVGIILGRTYKRSDEAWRVYTEWAAKWDGKRAAGHDARMREAFYEVSQQEGEHELTLGTIVRQAISNGWVPSTGPGDRENYVYVAETGKFIYLVTDKEWPSQSVDAHVSPVNVKGKIIRASEWIKANRLATSITKTPLHPYGFIRDVEFDREFKIVESHTGGCLYNSYSHPTMPLGDSKLAKPWVDHVRHLFPKPGDADQFLTYLAHRVQNPGQKPRFALVIGGPQGTGKDTAIEMTIPAIGAWNTSNIDPDDVTSGFNEFKAQTLVRINEVGNMHETSRFEFYQALKVFIAGNPDHTTINEKYGRKYTVNTYAGVIITTNHIATGLYIEDDDRRFDILESASLDEMGIANKVDRDNYFSALWEWYENEDGARHIAAYLTDRAIPEGFSTAGQRQTEAHRRLRASGSHGDEWFDDILEDMGTPPVIVPKQIISRATAKGMGEQEVNKLLRFALSRAKYTQFVNPERKDGRFKDRKTNSLYRLYVRRGTPEELNPHPYVAENIHFEEF